MTSLPVRRLRNSGQALVFGALTLFLVSAFCVMAFNVGWVSVRRLQLQHAADHGAYAGAIASANLLSEIAWLNEGMAYCHYAAMRHAVDVTVHGTLAELSMHAPVPAPDAVVGIADPIGTYNRVYADAAIWIPRLEHWSRKIQNIEYGMAAVAPVLVRQEIFRTAHETLGVDPSTGDPDVQISVFPEIPWSPDAGGAYTLTITRLANGWRFEDSVGFWIDIQLTGPDSWSVTSSTGDAFTVMRLADDHYRVTTATETLDLTYFDGLGWTVQASGGSSFSVAPGPNGGWTISAGGTTGEFRRGPSGTMERFSGGQWVPMGSGETVNVGGVEVPVQETSITVGNARIELNPLSIWIGQIHLTPFGSEMRIAGQIGPVSVTVENDYAVANGLDTRTADSLWYRLASDRGRHRMIPVASDRWTYEMVREDTILLYEGNMHRFAIVHAIDENDPTYLSTGALPAWAFETQENPTGWFDPQTGDLVGIQAYHQTRVCWVCGGAGGACPNCGGVDNDGDGRSDIRKYASDARQRVGASPHYQSVAVVRPMVLSETIFRYGLNVGAWTATGFWRGQIQEPLLPDTFEDPDWGMFAFASSRVGVMEGGARTYKFFDPNVQRDWVAFDATNLYEPDWDACLWAMRDQVDPADLNMALDVSSGQYLDTGIGYLLRGFGETGWFEQYDDRNPTWAVDARLRAMRDKEGRVFDPRSREVENAFRH